jgi:hypothetical protein
MGDTGLNVTTGSDMTRIQVSCEHQNGLIYVVPAERSWVCSGENLPGHALAGFLRELAAMQLPAVQDLMKQWGIYYRNLPRGGGEAASPGDDPAG